jgi:hypothetical protein
VLQLRGSDDPSLIVDADALWSQPETVLSRFGAQARPTCCSPAARRADMARSPRRCRPARRLSTWMTTR